MSRKRKPDKKVDTGTKYYKALYSTGDEEVFISDSLATAQTYAATHNAHGRTLISVKEYKELIDALL